MATGVIAAVCFLYVLGFLVIHWNRYSNLFDLKPDLRSPPYFFKSRFFHWFRQCAHAALVLVLISRHYFCHNLIYHNLDDLFTLLATAMMVAALVLTLYFDVSCYERHSYRAYIWIVAYVIISVYSLFVFWGEVTPTPLSNEYCYSCGLSSVLLSLVGLAAACCQSTQQSSPQQNKPTEELLSGMFGTLLKSFANSVIALGQHKAELGFDDVPHFSDLDCCKNIISNLDFSNISQTNSTLTWYLARIVSRELIFDMIALSTHLIY